MFGHACSYSISPFIKVSLILRTKEERTHLRRKVLSISYCFNTNPSKVSQMIPVYTKMFAVAIQVFFFLFAITFFLKLRVLTKSLICVRRTISKRLK